MRILVSTFVVTTTVLLAQAGRPTPAPAPARPATAAPARPATAAPTSPKPATPGAAAPTSGPGSTGSSNNNGGSAKIEGFDGVAWGMSYKEMKGRFRVMASNANAADNVEIISDNPEREMMIRRRDICYRYVF